MVFVSLVAFAVLAAALAAVSVAVLVSVFAVVLTSGQYCIPGSHRIWAARDHPAYYVYSPDTPRESLHSLNYSAHMRTFYNTYVQRTMTEYSIADTLPTHVCNIYIHIVAAVHAHAHVDFLACYFWLS